MDSLHHWLDTSLEALILLFIVLEYYFGRPDIVIKNEEKQRKRLRRAKFELPIEQSLTTGEMK